MLAAAVAAVLCNITLGAARRPKLVLLLTLANIMALGFEALNRPTPFQHLEAAGENGCCWPCCCCVPVLAGGGGGCVAGVAEDVIEESGGRRDSGQPPICAVGDDVAGLWVHLHGQSEQSDRRAWADKGRAESTVGRHTYIHLNALRYVTWVDSMLSHVSARLHMIALKKLVELVPVDLHCSNLGKTNFFGAIIRSLALVIAICLLCKAN